MKYGWRVIATQDMSHFVRDQLSLYIVHTDDVGTRVVKPIALELSDPIDIVAPNELEAEPSYIATELAQALYSALSYHLVGTDDPHAEITRLRNELHKANSRLDGLIEGFKSLGKRSA